MSEELEKSKPSRGIYLIPNFITTLGLFGGFSSIVAAMHAHFTMAALGVYLAMIADMLDGRAARLTNTQSEFGAQYDSLADVISFGVAPALIIYSWSLVSLGKVGWLVAFIFAAAGALRLARFNTQDDHAGNFFQGLSIPAAAGTVVSLVWVFQEYGFAGQGSIMNVAAAVVCVAVALAMVSNIPYYSFKQFNFSGKVPFYFILGALIILVAISINPPIVIFAGFAIYALLGPLTLLFKIKKQRNHGQTT